MEAEVVTTTESAPVPSSTESSAIAAPETSARPASALEAFAQVTADPSTTQETAATGQVEPGAVPPSTEKKGPIPFEVHSKALDNARTKASEEALAKHREQYGWAETVDRKAIEEAQRIGQLYTTDRAGYVRQLLAEAVTDPTLAPIVRSEAARILAGSRSAPAPSFEPDIPVYDDEHRLVNQTFSADKVRELITHSVAEALGKEIGPIKQDLETRQATAKADADKAAFEKSVDDIWTEANEVLPHFKEHQEAIGKVFATIPGPADKALRKAWAQVVGPTLEAKATSQVLDSFNKKKDAQTIDGSGRAASTPKRPRNPAELAAYMRSIAP